MRDVLFSQQNLVFLTHRLARSVYYDRLPVPGRPWPYAALYSFLEGRLVGVTPPGEAGFLLKEDAQEGGDTRTLEVWHTCEEFDRLLVYLVGRSDTERPGNGTGEK